MNKGRQINHVLWATLLRGFVKKTSLPVWAMHHAPYEINKSVIMQERPDSQICM